MLKVLHIVSAPMNYIGGLSIFVNNLIKSLKNRGIRSDVLSCSRQEMGKIEPQKLISTPYYREYRQKSYGRMWGVNPLSNVLGFLLRNGQNYDIIHIHSYIFFISIQAALFHRLRNKVPIVVHLHGGIQTQDYPAETIFQKLFLLFKKWVFDPLFGRFVISTADSIISVSRKDLFQVPKVFKLSRLTKCYAIPNGVDVTKFRSSSVEKRKYISFFGRLSAIKGFDIFVKIAQQLHKIDQSLHFLVIGSGGEFQHLINKFVKNYPVEYYPKISHKQMLKYYQRTKVFVLTSRVEGIPTTILEASACGIPVVASNVGGVSEAIDVGKTGQIYDISDISSAVTRILECLKPEFQEFTTRFSPLFIQEKFSWDKIGKNTHAVYRKLRENY